MTSDIRLAFDNLDARAAAAQGDNPADRISLREHVVDVEIGAFQAERGTTQRVCFNVVVEVRPPQKPLHDDVDRILSYDTITESIAQSLAEERLNLLETLAERIAELILHNPRSQRVFVRIEKLDRGPGALGVEIVRERDARAGAVDTGETLHPFVVFLSNAAIGSPLLTGWIDQLEATGKPVILCVGASGRALPQSAVPAAQRRIELLAVEQNAWVLAGKDPRCVVMGSRTEIDWAVQNNKISVWAPSKMVLDAIDVVVAQQDGPLALIDWFAGQIDAEGLIAVAEPDRAATNLPVINVALDQISIL